MRVLEDIKWGDLMYKGKHKAIITEKQFNRVQSIIKKKGGEPTKLRNILYGGN
jgi:hypothetical protein